MKQLFQTQCFLSLSNFIGQNVSYKKIVHIAYRKLLNLKVKFSPSSKLSLVKLCYLLRARLFLQQAPCGTFESNTQKTNDLMTPVLEIAAADMPTSSLSSSLHY